jgi:hypothetical protein
MACQVIRPVAGSFAFLFEIRSASEPMVSIEFSSPPDTLNNNAENP